MEGVKRAKSVQKKIVHNILSVLFANSDAFSIGRGTHCLRISLCWLLPACSFGGIFIHRSLQRSSELHAGISLATLRDKSARGILEIRKQKGGIVHEKKKTNSNSRYSFRQRRLRSELALRSRRSRKWTDPATSTNATDDPGAAVARSSTSGTNAGATRYYS